jgi:hypothetical protein
MNTAATEITAINCESLVILYDDFFNDFKSYKNGFLFVMSDVIKENLGENINFVQAMDRLKTGDESVLYALSDLLFIFKDKYDSFLKQMIIICDYHFDMFNKKYSDPLMFVKSESNKRNMSSREVFLMMSNDNTLNGFFDDETGYRLPWNAILDWYEQVKNGSRKLIVWFFHFCLLLIELINFIDNDLDQILSNNHFCANYHVHKDDIFKMSVINGFKSLFDKLSHNKSQFLERYEDDIKVILKNQSRVYDNFSQAYNELIINKNPLATPLLLELLSMLNSKYNSLLMDYMFYYCDLKCESLCNFMNTNSRFISKFEEYCERFDSLDESLKELKSGNFDWNGYKSDDFMVRSKCYDCISRMMHVMFLHYRNNEFVDKIDNCSLPLKIGYFMRLTN